MNLCMGLNIADLDDVRFAIQLFCHVRWLKTVGRARVCASLDSNKLNFLLKREFEK